MKKFAELKNILIFVKQLNAKHLNAMTNFNNLDFVKHTNLYFLDAEMEAEFLKQLKTRKHTSYNGKFKKNWEKHSNGSSVWVGSNLTDKDKAKLNVILKSINY